MEKLWALEYFRNRFICKCVYYIDQVNIFNVYYRIIYINNILNYI